MVLASVDVVAEVDVEVIVVDVEVIVVDVEVTAVDADGVRPEVVEDLVLVAVLQSMGRTRKLSLL